VVNQSKKEKAKVAMYNVVLFSVAVKYR